MIKRISILAAATFMICSSNLFAGEPSRFPISSNGVWRVYISQDLFNEDFSISYAEEFIKYFINGDTVINAKTYYKIYKSGTSYYDEPFSYENIYTGAIRDEANKIYHIEKDGSVEKILYDFNLNIDDTIKSIIGKGHIINEIDSLNDGRKKIGSIPMICAGCCPSPILLEGIGNVGGLFETPPCNHPGFQYNELVCYSEGDAVIYHNTGSTKNCETFNSLKPINGNEIAVTVYPNPASQNISVEFIRTIEFPLSIAIYNSCGSLLYSQKFYDSANRIDIGLENLTKGIYTIRIGNKRYSISKKIIMN